MITEAENMTLRKPECNHMAYRLQQREQATPAKAFPSPEASARRSKSSKMPDPMFDDGKTVSFETWVVTMRQKLEANADHFPTAVHWKLYVSRRCRGKAQLHIAPRLNPDEQQCLH